MKEKTNWERKSSIDHLYSTGPREVPKDGKLMKVGLVAAAGMIIAALARGVSKSEYFKPEKDDADTEGDT